MRERFRRSGKKENSVKRNSTPAKVFGGIALATGLALCPVENARAEDSTCKKEFKFLKLVDSEKKSDALIACFDGLRKNKNFLSMEERCFCIEILDLVVKKDVENADSNTDKFLDITESPNFSNELLEALKPLIEHSGGSEVSQSLSSIRSILENSNYCPDVGKTIELISQNPDNNSYLSLSAVSAILDNKNYTHELIETANSVLERYGERSHGPLQMIRNMILTSNVNVDIKGEDFEKRLFGVSDAVFSHYANNSYNIFMLLGLMSKQKSFTDEMFDVEYAEQISLALKDVAIKGDDVMRAMWLPIMHGNSDISIFFYEIDLVEQTNANSEYALGLLFNSLSNENLLPEVCTGHFIDDLAYIVNYIAGQNPGREKDMFYAFKKLLKSSNFTANMIDEKYPGILNTVTKKVAESGKNPFDYDSFLKNWGDKPKMPNKKFEKKYDETVGFILDKTDEHSKDVILAVDELVRNPNFEQSLFPTVKKIVEMTTSESIPRYNVISGEWSEPFSKYSTEAPKYLLDFDELLLNHPNLSEKELEKVMLFIEERGDLQVLDAMLANPVFRLEILDQENLDRARDMVEQINTADSDKAGRSLDADDIEILTNFSYALNVFEDDKDATKEEKIKKLIDERGIIYFARYSEKMLNQTYSSLDAEHKKDRPVAYVVFNQNDRNKSFYWEYDYLDKLLKYYNVIIYEMDSEDKFYGSVKETAEKHGQIDSLIIAGHGQVKEVNLGSGSGEASDIDTGDEIELESLNPYLVEKPTVILIACSSGHTNESIGAKLSDIWYATVWAPDEPTSLKNISTYKNGKIKKVKYYDDLTNKFENGVMVLKREKPYDEPDIPYSGLHFDPEDIINMGK